MRHIVATDRGTYLMQPWSTGPFKGSLVYCVDPNNAFGFASRDLAEREVEAIERGEHTASRMHVEERGL